MSLLDQYHALRRAAAIVDRSGRGRLLLSGADRRSYLQGLLSNDILALTAGSGCYATYLTAQGRMIADLRVFELGVPWAVFGITPGGGQTYGFTVSLNDDDSPGSPQQESLVASVRGRLLTDPTTWGRLTLDPAP